MGKFLAIVLVWAAVLGGMGFAYWTFVLNKDNPDNPTSSSGGAPTTKTIVSSGNKLKMAGDSFSGYCLFRSAEFKKRLEQKGIDFEWVDDGAKYDKRMETVLKGETPLAVFTIDALLTNAPRDGEMPDIVMLIDETRGADAMVSYPEGVKSVSDLNKPGAKVVLTEGSPSETLFRAVRSQFDLKMPPRKADYIIPASDKGAEDVFQKLSDAKHTENKVFVLWEPYVSLAKEKGAQVLVDSSHFKGIIVDVLVVQPKFRQEHPGNVEAVVRTYLDLLHEWKGPPDRMAGLVLEDAQKVINEPNIDSLEKARKVADGIWWKNTAENYAHFGLLQGPKAKNLQRVDDMVARIKAILVKTLDPGDPPLTVVREDKHIRPDFLKQLYDQRHFAEEPVRDEPTIQKRTDGEWDKLRPVAAFPVKEIQFSITNNMTGDYEEELKTLADSLRQWPQYYLRIEGHTTNVGDPEANMKKALQRADAVRKYLIEEQSIDPDRIQAKAMPPGGGKKVVFMALQP
jgi:ABC-type nitrate/sulfonate/bicarbonate transport system substrate-binding protein